jgi:hypothetical protein
MCRRWIVILPESYCITWIAEVKGKFYVVVAIAQAACEKTQKYVIPNPVRFLNGVTNLLFPWLSCEQQIPHPQTTRVRDDKSDSFRSLLGF